jgi:hypothetical protein
MESCVAGFTFGDAETRDLREALSTLRLRQSGNVAAEGEHGVVVLFVGPHARKLALAAAALTGCTSIDVVGNALSLKSLQAHVHADFCHVLETDNTPPAPLLEDDVRFRMRIFMSWAPSKAEAAVVLLEPTFFEESITHKTKGLLSDKSVIVFAAASLWTGSWPFEMLQKALFGSKTLVYQTHTEQLTAAVSTVAIDRRDMWVASTPPFPPQHIALVENYVAEPTLDLLLNIHCVLCYSRVDVQFFPVEHRNFVCIVETQLQREIIERQIRKYQRDPRNKHRRIKLYLRRDVLSDSFSDATPYEAEDYALVFPFCFALTFYENWCLRKFSGYNYVLSYSFLNDWQMFDSVEDALKWGQQKLAQFVG